MVYRTATRQVDPSLELSRCLTMPAEDIEAMTSRLLGIGSIEVALSDLWAPLRDGRDPRILASSQRPVRRSCAGGCAGCARDGCGRGRTAPATRDCRVLDCRSLP